MPDIGVPELLIVAFIVILLFGPSKAADLGGSLGKSIREFRKASREDGEPDAANVRSPQGIGGGAATIADAAAAATPRATHRFCTNCGTQLEDGQRFCTSCGASAPVTV